MSKDINEKVNEMVEFFDILKLIEDDVIINMNEDRVKKFSRTDKVSSKVVFDSNSYNFHVFPEDNKLCEKLASEFAMVRNILIIELHKKFTNKECFAINKNIPKAFYTTYDDGIIKEAIDGNKLIGGVGSATRGKSKNYRYLYKFVEIFYNSSYYTINFMRYTCAEGKVGCTMREIQFHKSTFNKGFNLNQSKDKRFEICYPLNAEDNSRNTIPRKLKNEDKFTSVCYNPPVKWPNKAPFGEKENWDKGEIEKIVTEFIKFVKNEGKN